jgi:hypothetical protein
MKISFNTHSRNAKTGNIPVSMSEKSTCPDACGLKQKGCYAMYSNVNIHWNNVSKGKTDIGYDAFIKGVRKLPMFTLWRHNVAGDLAGENNTINKSALVQLVNANKGKKGFTYTHKPLNETNMGLIQYANNNGFAVNISTDNISDADNAMALKIAPVVVLMPRGAEKVTFTPNGNKVVLCPANKKVTCATCGLCAKIDRPYIIGFKAHGTAAKTVEIIARSA